MDETQTNNIVGEETNPTVSKKKKDIGMAVVAYLLFFVPLLTEAKHDTFVMYHVRQGFLLFVAFVTMGIIAMIPTPLIFVAWLAQIGLVVLMIIGIFHALGGKEEPLPFLGQFSNKVPF